MCHISQDMVGYGAVTNIPLISVGEDHKTYFSVKLLVVTGHLGASALCFPHFGKQAGGAATILNIVVTCISS